MALCMICLEDSSPLVDTSRLITGRKSTLFTYCAVMGKVILTKRQICELCKESLEIFFKLWDTINDTEKKIKTVQSELLCKTISLKSICDTTSVLTNLQNCRVCLQPVKQLGIYLYDRETNVLKHDLIVNMLLYCNIKVMDMNSTERPVLCIDCFQSIQTIYSFKRNFEDITRRVTEHHYLKHEFNVSYNEITDNTMRRLKKDIAENNNLLSETVVQLSDIDDMVSNISVRRCRKKRRKYSISSAQAVSRCAPPRLDDYSSQAENKECKLKGSIYSEAEDRALLKLYYKHTHADTISPKGLWEEMCREWNDTMPFRRKRSLIIRLYKIKNTRLLSSEVMDAIKAEVMASLNAVTVPKLSVVNGNRQTEADDAYVEIVASPAMTPPRIKQEAESDVEVEMWFADPVKVEPDTSETERAPTAPPQLDRMDSPTLEQLRVADKKKIPQHYVIEHNYCRKDLQKEFRCSECFFTTFYEESAKRHTRQHRENKITVHQCPKCSYSITRKTLLKRHVRTYHGAQEKEIPALAPWYSEVRNVDEKRQKPAIVENK